MFSQSSVICVGPTVSDTNSYIAYCLVQSTAFVKSKQVNGKKNHKRLTKEKKLHKISHPLKNILWNTGTAILFQYTIQVDHILSGLFQENFFSQYHGNQT